MAGIALVKAGSITTAATTTVAPAFGQATTAGNFLVARVVASAASSTGSITTAGAGWVQASQLTGGLNGAAVFYKLNCAAGETAPTFTCTSATFMAADLLEFSGAATFLPLDQTGTGTGNIIPANSAKDLNQADLAVAALVGLNSMTTTYTVSDAWTPASGTEVANQNTGATSSTHVYCGSAYLLGGHGGAAADTDTFTITPGSGAFTSQAWAIASFGPSVAPLAVISQPRRIRGPKLPPPRSVRTLAILPRTITVASGSPVSNTGTTSIGFTTQAIGDAVVLFVDVIGNRGVAKVSSSLVNWDGAAMTTGTDATSGRHWEAWKGVVTAIGSDTASVVLA